LSLLGSTLNLLPRRSLFLTGFSTFKIHQRAFLPGIRVFKHEIQPFLPHFSIFEISQQAFLPRPKSLGNLFLLPEMDKIIFMLQRSNICVEKKQYNIESTP